jgi:dynactin complex subunit
MKRNQHPLPPALSRSNESSNVRRQSVRPNTALDAQIKRLSARMDQMESELDRIKSAGTGNSGQGVREQIEKNGADLNVQFQRIAMMQAEIDRLKANETALQTEIDQLRAKNRQLEPTYDQRTAPKA